MLQSKRRPTDPETVTDDALRMMCENVLQLMTTTVDGIDQVWKSSIHLKLSTLAVYLT